MKAFDCITDREWLAPLNAPPGSMKSISGHLKATANSGPIYETILLTAHDP